MKKTKNISVAIVGSHYSGKTTLGKLLQEKYNFVFFEEEWFNNPLKEYDYFHKEVWFLLHRIEALEKALKLKKEGKNVALDTLPESTLIFAKTKLDKKEFKIFFELYKYLIRLVEYPDKVIYLKASPEFLYKVRLPQRVKEKTGPPGEEKTPFSWLKKIIALHHKTFSKWEKTDIITINVETVDIKRDTKKIIKAIYSPERKIVLE